MRDLDELFESLAQSSFRWSFQLRGDDLAYLQDKGIALIMLHAKDFILKRLASAVIPNDGKQTPFSGHPVFIAQHATACCCRGCLAKWHRIEAGHQLNDDEIRHVLAVLERWLRSQSEVDVPRQSDFWL